MLTQEQVRWIVNTKLPNRQIANVMNISVRWVKELKRGYRETGTVPIFKKMGRPKLPITDEERRIVIDVYQRYKVGACYLEAKLKE